MKPKAVILSGGPDSVTREGTAPGRRRPCSMRAFPCSGICYGQQTTAVQLGGKVERWPRRGIRPGRVSSEGASALFEGLWSDGANAIRCG